MREIAERGLEADRKAAVEEVSAKKYAYLLAKQIVELTRYCLEQAPGRRMQASLLGTQLREAAPRRGVCADQLGQSSSLSKYMKSQWGGMEGFVRANPDVFAMSDGVLALVSIDGPPEPMALPERMPEADRAVESRTTPGRDEINALTLDAL